MGNKQGNAKITANVSVVPPITFKARVRDESIGGPNPFKFKDVSTIELFKGKRVVLFALPGAFTPTCSTTHLPKYVERYDELIGFGIDEVYCLSVNDAFVMRQWGIHLGLETEEKDSKNPLNPGNFKKVKLIPDGAAKFTRAMGMSTMWDDERGFGERSWRYSAVINDMQIEKLFIENGKSDNSIPDPFELSGVEKMLEYLSNGR